LAGFRPQGQKLAIAHKATVQRQLIEKELFELCEARVGHASSLVFCMDSRSQVTS
jgi:hypothetical protein